jgi:hypothetical protein
MSALLSNGCRGPEVVQLQTLLNASRPTALPPLRVDGAFGPRTAARVQEFQRNHGLRPDGVVGPETWAALDQVDPALAFAALRPLFYGARIVLRYDAYRLALVTEIEAALEERCRPQPGNLFGVAAAGVLTNPLFWMLIIIIVFTILLVSDPVHRANLTKLKNQAVEAVEERGEEAKKKARRIAEQVKEFWKQLTEVKTDCERGADPAKLAECTRKFGLARKAAFDRVGTVINRILTRRFDQFGRSVPIELIKELRELARAIKDYVDALNDLLRCLGCPEIPYPDVPGLPLPG